MKKTSRALAFAGVFAGLFLAHGAASGQDNCPNRGDLDTMYCDADKDLVGDTPTDASKLRNPSTLVFTYTPVEDPAVYADIFSPFTKHLSECLGRDVRFYQVQSVAAETEAMRSGRLHVGGFSTGPTNYAVNLAGAVPFAVKRAANRYQGYHLILIARKDRPFQTMTDLK